MGLVLMFWKGVLIWLTAIACGCAVVAVLRLVYKVCRWVYRWVWWTVWGLCVQAYSIPKGYRDRRRDRRDRKRRLEAPDISRPSWETKEDWEYIKGRLSDKAIPSYYRTLTAVNSLWHRLSPRLKVDTILALRARGWNVGYMEVAGLFPLAVVSIDALEDGLRVKAEEGQDCPGAGGRV
jgi:hypothetical protein